MKVATTIVGFGPAAAIELTEQQVDDLGGGKRAPVIVTIAGKTARLRLSSMGGKFPIGLSKASRAELGVEIGDQVTAEIVLDTSERTVEVPEDLAAVFQDAPDAKAAFDGLSYSHRKEFVRWITEAKREQTRRDRLDKTVEMLREGKTRQG